MKRAEYDKLVKDYVEAEGEKSMCPACGSDKIGVSDTAAFVNRTEVGLNGWCIKCKKTWMEYYKLHGLELRDEKGGLIDRMDLEE